ncbi:hypothetical protein [Frigidibacter sp. ROC022]|uniref:hypothetical protein n=1 Tax=Frigidibacter sp. ROC022 TaxID=2971796 RepID=UPI00215B2F08|nr:hypothetical protein [Frigidibacter sp. ROC022]MCR8725890.1 hypothetical protein [Frigidibacter sp. ROC022]
MILIGRLARRAIIHMAAALAASNLWLGHTVIVDCINPWDMTRRIFADAAKRADAGLLGVETRCSDLNLHRARVEERDIDVPGLCKPDWQDVLARDYTPWATADVQIDTAKMGVADAVSEIRRHL